VTVNPAEQIANELRAQLRPGESVERGPGGALYLAAERFFVAKFNPTTQTASVTAYDNREIGDVLVVSGRPQGEKPPGWFVEVGLSGSAPTGLKDPDEVAYSERPNVIYCGRGAEAEEVARALADTVKGRKPAPPPPPPPPPPPKPAAGPPAQWFPDPTGKARLRYWDGTAWTSHTAD
jgi:hypothetical protein